MRRGFTLLEMMLVLVISSMILIGFTTAVVVSQRTQGNVEVVSDLENDTNEAVKRIADELRSSGTTSTDFDCQANQIHFSPCTGQAGGVPTWDHPRLLTLSPFSVGEDDIWDGTDNNGNGLVDESALVLSSFDGVDAHEEVLVTGISSGGLVLTRNGNEITISLTMTRVNDDGATMTANATTLVSLRD